MSKMMIALCSGVLVATTSSALGSELAVAKVDLCVGSGGGCFHTIQAAVDASNDGDTISVSAGTLGGGVTITKSVTVVGSGAGVTIVRGGGPVITVGDESAPASAQPTVAIARLTVTGGVAHGDGIIAVGGGILIPPSGDGSLGATVELDHVAVVGNRAAPTEVEPSTGVPCPDGDCPFAASIGGGIFSNGTLSLSHSVVSGNRAAGVASDVGGGGIFSAGGAVTVGDSVVVDNHATARPPIGRFAEGGGIDIDLSGSLTVTDSIVSHNSARLTSTLPSFAGDTLIEMSAHSGGIHVGDGIPVTVVGSTINYNTVSATDLNGEPIAFDSAMLAGGGGPLSMRDTVIRGNRVVAKYATSVDVGSGGSALEADGAAFISRTRIVNNPSIARSPHGVAAVSAGVAVLDFDGDPKLVVLSHSVVSGNTALAVSSTGSAVVLGAGFFNNSLLELRHVLVSDNAGRAVAPDATAQGGGIWNGVLLSGPPVTLALRHSPIVGNSVSGSTGAVLQGGGLFTTEPVTIDDSPITANTPDQCFGCGTPKTDRPDHRVARPSSSSSPAALPDGPREHRDRSPVWRGRRVGRP